MKKVFVADDNELFATAVTDLLAFHGHDFKVAGEGADIMSQIQEYRPDILILDIKMPSANGLDICRQVRSDPGLKSAHVIILSCLDTDADIQAGRAAGADNYLVKPFSPPEVIKIIQSVG
ncbi:MAG: response regulator transcription factor [Nitrospirota bacterium]